MIGEKKEIIRISFFFQEYEDISFVEAVGKRFFFQELKGMLLLFILKHCLKMMGLMDHQITM
ncbi:hypothetical protein BFG57_07140 [Bacillus solimangrovi]|uniref:Uncharacterized protein n=1 Tax=Bacillus solimangrovi TaxID=1305675 RepID=A0A1E5LAW3_9BACI|nr:hypothetical protein BFG57_07140 [Bacillus solimangrovi]